MKTDALRPALKLKIRQWMVSFHRLDPRYKILTFFNQVASDGADNLCNDDEDYDFGPPKPELTQFEKKLNDAFNTTSILTVWRPCSNDAMRLMMQGGGVGKGLDIKGKSAKKGTLSAYVPFLQISENEHKQNVSPLSATALVRVYFATPAARNHAVVELEKKAEQVKAQVQRENKEREEAEVVAKLSSSFTSKALRNAKFRFSAKEAATRSTARERKSHHSRHHSEEKDGEKHSTNPAAETPLTDAIQTECQTRTSTQEDKESTDNNKIAPSSSSRHDENIDEQQESAPTRSGNSQKERLDNRQTMSSAASSGEEGGRSAGRGKPANESAHNNESPINNVVMDPSIIIEEEKKSHENEDERPKITGKSLLLNKFRAAALTVKEETQVANAVASSGARKITSLVDQFKEKVATECKTIDDYAPKHYGIECSQRLFWKTFVLDQDITRTEKEQTGRPSTPGFQDANMHSLANGMKNKTDPLPVLLQTSCDDPVTAMKPQTLVMAYEENKKVVPVVSDFDGFLLGWRREALWFGCDLPREQEDLMLWCVKHIEALLDSPPSTESWTSQWLDILKKEKKNGFHPEIPPYGFGDPKSYAIMENAALRLIDTGAVRHGSECFNYYFPQEIDDMFLVISDTLSPVPWKYVDVTELQAILSDRIDDGFMFPLNPKWILCDPGWKKLYDKLLASDALYADLSKDVWFPPYSGVRKKIDEIHKRHPHGFRRRAHSHSSEDFSRMPGSFGWDGQAAAELAELELENYDGNETASEDGGVETQPCRRRRRRYQRTKGADELASGSSHHSGSSSAPKRRGVFGRLRRNMSEGSTDSGDSNGKTVGLSFRWRSRRVRGAEMNARNQNEVFGSRMEI